MKIYIQKQIQTLLNKNNPFEIWSPTSEISAWIKQPSLSQPRSNTYQKNEKKKGGGGGDSESIK